MMHEDQINRRNAIKKAAVGAAAAGVVWSGPRIERLSLRPAYAAAASGEMSYTFAITHDQVVNPPTPSTGSGTGDITVDPATGLISWTITFMGLTGPPTIGHIHGPAAAGSNAGVSVDLSMGGATSPATGSATDIAQASAICADPDLYYVNIHTSANPGGEIRGQLA